MADVRASRRRGGRLWFAALLCLWNGAAAGGAGFGPMVEHPLSFSPAAVAVVSGPPGSRSEILVLARDQQLVAGHILTDEGILIETRTFRPPDRSGAIVQGDFNGDGKREFSLLSAGGTRVHSNLRRPAGWVSRRLPPGVRATKLLSADLNSDGFGDLLCYGKSMAGGVVFFGSPTGLADSAFTILPEISIADAAVSDVNGDRVPDLLVADWLGNSTTLFMGLDGLTFTEALRVDVPGEPLEVDIAEALPGIPALFAVLISDGNAIRTYSVQKGGEVSLTEDLRLDTRANDVRLVDTDGNRRPELLAATASGLLVSELTRGQRFGPWMNYGVFTGPGGFAVRDVDGDRKRDLVAVDGSRLRLVVCANSASVATSWPDAFVTPGEPVAAVLSDVNLDGKQDLVVACRRPPVLAVLGNDGRGMYALGHTVSIPDKPAAVIAVSGGRGGRPTFLTTHTAVNSVGVISVDEHGAPATVRTIATGERPHTLTAVRDSAGALRVLVMTGTSTGHGFSFSWFEELPTGQFVERPSGLPTSVRILQAVADGRNEGPASVALLVRAKDRNGLIAWQGGTLPSDLVPFGAVSGQSTRLLAAELTRRGDFTVFFSGDGSGSDIGVTTFSGSSGEWTQPVLMRGVSPDAGAVSIASDLTGDGRTDLLYTDRKNRMIVLLPGPANGMPAETRDVLEVKGARLVAVGDPGFDGGRDLVVLRDGANSVSIVRGALTP